MGFWLRSAIDDAPVPVSVSANRGAMSAPYGAPRAITASAERITIQNAAYAGRVQLEWQRAAWVAYERVGEIHFGFNLLAGLLSRVRFYGAAKGTANEPPTDVGAEGRPSGVSKQLEEAVKQAVDELFAHDAPGMIRNFVLTICVPGECLLVELPATAATPSRWAIRSTSELQVRGDGSAVLLSRRDGAQQTTLPARHLHGPDLASPSPAFQRGRLLDAGRGRRRRGAADVAATRPGRHAFTPQRGAPVRAGRVASAVNPKRTAEPPVDEKADPFDALRNASVEDPSGKFLADLVETMTKPINDESSAATIVPMLVTGPGDEGQKIRHITFERATDAWLTDRIEKVLDRILQGIDMPKEIITGMESVKYSNAVIIDEGMYKANIEPLALTAADAFTAVYLHPRLKALQFSDEDIAKVVVWYDPSEIVTRPNSADEATEGLDRGVLSATAWRREHGYAESDAPSEEERAAQLLTKVGVLPQSVVVELLRQSYPKVFADLPDPEPEPKPPDVGQSDDPNVVPFPQGQNQPAQPPADPQRTAIKQVGVT